MRQDEDTAVNNETSMDEWFAKMTGAPLVMASEIISKAHSSCLFPSFTLSKSAAEKQPKPNISPPKSPRRGGGQPL